MSEWISVNKYNPPFDMGVLAIIKHADHIGASEIQVCLLDEDEGEWMLESTYEDSRDRISVSSLNAEITHWMILPEMPK